MLDTVCGCTEGMKPVKGATLYKSMRMIYKYM